MHSYEIRIINPDGRTASVHSSTHVGDFAAIRRATALADGDDVIEVWRGIVCVYRGLPAMALAS